MAFRDGRPVFPRVEPGDYCKAPDGTWWVATPEEGVMGPLTEHTVEEHEDGTITVSPSILVTGGYHGFLRRGEWS